jgi:hypothetical protein
MKLKDGTPVMVLAPPPPTPAAAVNGAAPKPGG